MNQVLCDYKERKLGKMAGEYHRYYALAHKNREPIPTFQEDLSELELTLGKRLKKAESPLQVDAACREFMTKFKGLCFAKPS